MPPHALLLLVLLSVVAVGIAVAAADSFARLLEPGYEAIRDRCLVLSNVCLDQVRPGCTVPVFLTFLLSILLLCLEVPYAL